MVLNNIATPRAKFILWLVLWGRLATKDRLVLFNIAVDPVCVFCHHSPETLDHLYFECPVLQRAWSSLLAWLGRRAYVGNLRVEMPSICNDVKGKNVTHRFYKVLLTEFIYVIWIEQNRRIFHGVAADLQCLLRQVAQVSVCHCSLQQKMQALCSSISDYPVY